MTIELSAEVRARLDAHLDAVEDALRGSGGTREQRRGIVDDLEAQILDMLAGRPATPTLADLEAVLQKLDPPAAYADGAPARTQGPTTALNPPATQRRLSRTALAGLTCLLASLAPLLVLVVLWANSAAHRASTPTAIPTSDWQRDANGDWHQKVMYPAEAVPSERSASKAQIVGIVFSLILLAPLALACTVLGWIAFFQIRDSGGTLRGKGLALFDGLFYPASCFVGLGLFMA